LVLDVEDQLVGGRDVGEVATGGVDDPLRLRRRARGVEDEERVLRVHGLRGAIRVRVGDRLMPEEIAALGHRRVGPAAIHHHDALELGQLPDHLVHRGLHRGGLPPPQRGIGGHQHLGVREVHPLLDRLGREAAEHHVVDRSDPRAGEHRRHGLRDHRQEDPDDVPLLDPEAPQDVGEPLGRVEQVCVGDLLAGPVLALPVVGDSVPMPRVHVAVEAVRRRVERPAGKPLGERRIGPVEHRVPRPRPVELLGPRRPPGLGVRVGALVDPGVAGVRLCGELGGRGKRLLGLQQDVELGAPGPLLGDRVSHHLLLLQANSAG
jgi:hypothetical protein